MTQINYVTVLEIGAKTLEEESELEVNATGLKSFEATIKLFDNSKIFIRGHMGEYSMDFAIKKEEIEERKLKKWIDKLEYHLEQEFLKNVKVSYHSNMDEYLLEISI